MEEKQQKLYQLSETKVTALILNWLTELQADNEQLELHI